MRRVVVWVETDHSFWRCTHWLCAVFALFAGREALGILKTAEWAAGSAEEGREVVLHGLLFSNKHDPRRRAGFKE